MEKEKNIPRPEYPRPQMVREDWVNLNGEWEFEFDFGDSGVEQRFFEKESFSKKIVVPFCPESPLSQIEYTDFMAAVWYKRSINLTEKQLEKQILLHFGAVDYHCRVWINGEEAGAHKGGYSSFNFDITKYARVGENTIVVYAQDDLRSGKQPFGKQSPRYKSFDCSYTRTTGIWQTVWLELVNKSYITNYRVVTFPESSSASISVWQTGPKKSFTVSATAKFDGRVVGEKKIAIDGGFTVFQLDLSEKHLWEIGSPNLYDLTLELYDGENKIDTVEGYFGLRDISLKDGALCINQKPVFMRTVLDQGFNPQGIYTAPTDEFLKHDIELSMDLGFNGARLHQRVFEERFLYWADKLGYIVWGEIGNNSYMGDGDGLKYFLPEWTEVVKRDFNHPSIIGWMPFNETYWVGNLDREIPDIVRMVTKHIDPTRPVIDASGGLHGETDMFDVHNYEQDPKVFRESFEAMKTDDSKFCNPLNQPVLKEMNYQGEPYWISEYGGTFWNGGVEMGESEFSYGVNPKTEEEFAERYSGLTKVLLDHPKICGFCYTQLTDVEQERNGLYYYDRSPKFKPEIYDIIRKANQGEAEIEK